MTILIVTHDTDFVTSLTDRVLCLGDSGKIVQHKTETKVSSMRQHHGAVIQEVRVLHSETDPSHESCG
jgi:zinc transport system ATP-binding protein